MKAVVAYHSRQALAVEQRPDPECGADDVVIRVERCGICGSELHMREGPERQFSGGMIMGHEFAGEIVALGNAVTDLRLGQRVATFPALGCGQCVACDHSNPILCGEAQRILGGFAEYARIPARAAIALPDGLSAADAALIAPLTVSLAGVRMAALSPKSRVLVLGEGTIALTAIWWARLLGAGRIVAMSRSAHRAEMAQTMGADAFVCYGEREVERTEEALGGAADIVLECVGVPGMLSKAIGHLSQFGQVLSLGFGTALDPVVPAQAALKAATLQFSIGYSQDDFRYVAKKMLTGHVDPKLLITRTIGLDQLPATFEGLLGPHNETKVQVAAFG